MAVDLGVGQALPRALYGARDFGMPVRRGIAQAADDGRQARCGNRRIDRHHGVDEVVET
jgi:hypothetical protein